MERIEPSNKSKSFRSRKRSGSTSKEKSERVSFTDSLSIASSQSRVESANRAGFSSVDGDDDRTIEEILDDIFGIGEKLKKDAGHQSVMTYKRAVQRLVRIVLERGLRVEETTSSPNILRQKRFTLVQVIDQKLDRLVSEVLQSQHEALNVLGKIDEINGLLVDLTS